MVAMAMSRSCRVSAVSAFCRPTTHTPSITNRLVAIVHVLHSHQRRTEPWPQVKCTENYVKCAHVVFKICDWTAVLTDIRHTDTLITVLHPLLGMNQHWVQALKSWHKGSDMKRECMKKLWGTMSDCRGLCRERHPAVQKHLPFSCQA